ncbi:MAG: [FeFe] hydrogenase H-cluster maturation GTPase HydF, partial [Candidatus Fibromonas sp.]|jgi:[FeFe] hydrogenase H-cluster maturation GTPase HydF|nr:[FeFe] hydrogenase H-cluster maturation GTPase HydF [Candidatus Fibromonas sp.]
MAPQKTPNASRLHIGIFGKVNCGKSTLLNALASQEVALVSEKKGTTTDPVYKAMEINGLGPVVFIDTAGYEDASDLGIKRIEKTKQVTEKTDIAIVIFADTDIHEGILWVHSLKKQNVKVIIVVNDMENNNAIEIVSKLEAELDERIIVVNALKKHDIDKVKTALIENAPEDEKIEITGSLAKESDIVMLIMPQDKQAPKGRLILPQVQTIRELLDKKCIVISCTTDKIDETLATLNKAPSLIICDSQVFKIAYEKKPKESKLTSFSVLYAAYKGDIETYLNGAKAIDNLKSDSHILIAEACTHAPLTEDIGREKIPNLLRQKFGNALAVTVVSGMDFPKDLTKYALIIHCGACMFNRKYVLSRIEEAKRQGVPITNYGVAIAHLLKLSQVLVQQ